MWWSIMSRHLLMLRYLKICIWKFARLLSWHFKICLVVVFGWRVPWSRVPAVASSHWSKVTYQSFALPIDLALSFKACNLVRTSALELCAAASSSKNHRLPVNLVQFFLCSGASAMVCAQNKVSKLRRKHQTWETSSQGVEDSWSRLLPRKIATLASCSWWQLSWARNGCTRLHVTPRSMAILIIKHLQIHASIM